MSVLLFGWGYAWDLHAIDKDIAFIVDKCEPGSMSLTNAAEAVCLDALWVLGGRRIVYRDTEGRWDELLHDDDGCFLGFAPYDGPIPERGARDV